MTINFIDCQDLKSLVNLYEYTGFILGSAVDTPFGIYKRHFLALKAVNVFSVVSIFKIGVELLAPHQMGFQFRVFIFIDWF